MKLLAQNEFFASKQSNNFMNKLVFATLETLHKSLNSLYFSQDS